MWVGKSDLAGGAMRFTIGFKIFGIAVGLLVLMGAAALLSLRMTRTVDAQLVVIDRNYFPAFSTLAAANIHSLEEGMYARRLALGFADGASPDPERLKVAKERIAAAAKATDVALAEARRNINDQIDDPLDFNDNVALARLDTRVEYLQDQRLGYEEVLARLVTAVEAGNRPEAGQQMAELDRRRDEFDRRINTAQDDMRKTAGNAIVGTRDYQLRAIEISSGILAIAGLLGLTVAAAVTMGLVRPVRRLLAGTAAVEKGALDTLVPITSRDEIGSLTHSFNNMVGELRVKAQIRETFGKYVDPRIVEGLIDCRN